MTAGGLEDTDHDSPDARVCPVCHGERILPHGRGQFRRCSFCKGMPTTASVSPRP